MTITNNTASKLVVAFVAVAMLLTLSFAPMAKAATDAELEAQIKDLLAKIAALQGQSGQYAQASYTFTRDLTVGSTGEDVKQLQMFLNSKGYAVATVGVGSAGMETLYFGGLTRAAVARYQAAKGIAPAVGYFGPITRGAVNADIAVVVPPPPPPPPGDDPDDPNDEPDGPLEGGAGSADYNLMSEFASEQVGEDEEDVEVTGLEIEAENSDLDFTAVRLVFAQGTAGSDFEDYADEVSVWLDGEEVGRVDGDRFNDGNTYSSTITLDGAIIREDDKGELVVAVSGVNNLDTNDAGDTWTVDFRSVRFADATGASISEDPTTAVKTFSFESFATAADSRLDMRLTTGDDADKINKAHLINTHLTDENELKGVPLLEFTMEAEGDTDLEIRDFGVDLVVTGAADVDDLIAGGTAPEVFLKIEGQRYGTAAYNETAANNREIAFTDVDYTIDAGDTVTVQIVANMAALDTDADAGDTILAQLLEAQTDDTALFDVRDESGTQILDADIVGEPTGEASTLRDSGFDLTFKSGTATRSHAGDVANANDHDEGTFTLVFEVSAWDDNATSIFIDNTAPTETGGATESDMDVTGTDTYITSSIERTGGDTAVESANSFAVLAGDTVQFTITYVTAAGADGLFDVSLGSLLYALTDVDGDLTVADAQIDLLDFKTTPPISLNFDG